MITEDLVRASVDGGTVQGFKVNLPSKDELAATLRRAADKLESGELLVQKIRVTVRGKLDDFALASLRLTFAEKRDDADR